MNVTGKIIGAVIGFLLMGPLGLLLGIYLGHGFDIQHWQRLLFSSKKRPASNKVYAVFFETTFLTLGYIAKADGRVSENEIAYAKRVMREMHLSQYEMTLAQGYFMRGKSSQFQLRPALQAFLLQCRHDTGLVRLYLQYQQRMAEIDPERLSDKRAIIALLHQWLNARAYQQHSGPYQQNKQGHSQRSHQSHRAASTPSLDDDFNTLGLANTTDKKAIKRAYRKLMSRYHPDRLIAKKAAASEIQHATELTQKIQAAYERIRKQIGFN